MIVVEIQLQPVRYSNGLSFLPRVPQRTIPSFGWLL